MMYEHAKNAPRPAVVSLMQGGSRARAANSIDESGAEVSSSVRKVCYGESFLLVGCEGKLIVFK